MQLPKIRIGSPVIGVLSLLLFTDAAQAYIDPGTGSMIFQVLIGAVFGAGIAIKVFWSQIKSLWSRLFGKRGGPHR
jgi:energy-coupling factor transporter transmembrane protein EcfT